MKKYTIELSEEQMRLVSNCLEDISRFASGKLELRYTIEQMLKGLTFEERMSRRNEAEKLLEQLKRILLPEESKHSSKGYDGTEFIGNIYQIYRTMLYQLAIDNNWDNVYSSSALPSGTLGTIKIELIKEL
jgi:hypothetical protein